MPRLQALIECVGQAIGDKGKKALRGQQAYADVLQDTARAFLDLTFRKLPGADLLKAFGDAATCTALEYERRCGELVPDIAQTHAVPIDALTDYLRAFPPTVRQILRRPSDPDGHAVPEKAAFFKSEDLLPFLPPRPPRFRPGDHPEGLDGWKLVELRGIGECSEVWRGEDPAKPDESPAALKFALDPPVRERVQKGTEIFTKVFGLNHVSGVLPLRSVFLETDPPCLESPFVSGYDLAGLMFDWKWRYDHGKPAAALKLVQRLAAIVAEAHTRGVVHRDLKPSNVILHPTEGGKFTMWVTDFGWGQMEAPRALELARVGHRGEQQRLAHRGACTVLYASPQQAKNEPPMPTDDVHALGVIWYQLLKRNPAAPAPVGTEWVEEFRPHGFNDSQARVLINCLSTRTDKRPRTATHLVEQLGQVTVAPSGSHGSDPSKLSLKSASSTSQTPAMPSLQRQQQEEDDDDRASASRAAAMLAAVGGEPITAGRAPTSTYSKHIKNSVGMLFTRLPAGSFTMGANEGDKAARDHESPAHAVKISKSFFLAVHPVTQAQYEKVMGRNPAKFSKSKGGGPDHPVESVTWKDAESFCVRLAQLPEEEAQRRHYRLPTEAEWEYACRAGTTTTYSGGNWLAPADALTASGAGKFADKSTAPVGGCAANPWGLHDLHGNVQEWVSDWYDEYYYTESSGEDPPGPARGLLKVARGGCWNMTPADARSSARRSFAPDTHSDTIGFRVVMVVG